MNGFHQTVTLQQDTYDISNHWFNRLDRRFLRPYFGPKTRRNVNRPLTSMDEIEMDEQMAKRGGTGKRTSDPQLALMEKGDKKGFDMDYINTNTNESEAEAASDRGQNDQIQGADLQDSDQEERNRGHLKADDVHLSVEKSKAKTEQPSFIDNPDRESRDHIDFSESSKNTWSDMNSMNQMSVSTMEPQRSAAAVNKAVTPPPNEVAQVEHDHDILSSIPKEQDGKVGN